MPKDQTWPAIVDELRRRHAVPDDDIGIDGSDVSNVLLMLLATLLEPSPVCATPAGIRRTTDAAGSELGLLIRDTRRLKVADMQGGGSTH